MKIWLLALFIAVPALADNRSAGESHPPDMMDGWEAAAPEDTNGPTESWVDSSYGYATDQTQALSEWMDSFFGVPNYEVELPESLVRIDFTTDWDQDDGNNNNVRLRGKVQLPKLSKRLNLVFSDESGDELDIDTNNNDDRNLDSGVGFLYEVTQGKRSRFDLTMGINWNSLRPGARYRYQDTLGDVSSYRLTQRVQYENGEGVYGTSQVELNRALSENSIMRWVNKAVYGEETKGAEWLTRLSLFQRTHTLDRRRKLGINYFGSVNGVTDPEHVKNYRLGVLFRRQVYRRFLFLELEPAYNYRKQRHDEKRQFAWSIAVRFQIALERDLARNKTKNSHVAKNTPPDQQQALPAHAGSAQQQSASAVPVANPGL